jgi:hypothetical protein
VSDKEILIFSNKEHGFTLRIRCCTSKLQINDKPKNLLGTNTLAYFALLATTTIKNQIFTNLEAGAPLG